MYLPTTPDCKYHVFRTAATSGDVDTVLVAEQMDRQSNVCQKTKSICEFLKG